ncbi:MAG: toprim domain-containing protein [Verrucomicrobiaceae bacterium]|nr:toprim domain-containing protein [Verrucomicrobiaceae bacterium]
MSQNTKARWVDFAHVKASVTIDQVLVHYGIRDQFKPQGSGQSLRGPCPIHGGKAKDFSVDLSKNIWICHSSRCSCGGNVLDLVRLKEQTTLRQAAILLCDWFNISDTPNADSHPVSADSNQPRRQKPKEYAQKQEPPKAARESAEEAKPNKPLSFALSNLDPAHPYLAERGLTAETIEHFGLGFCAKGMMAGRVVVPIHNAAAELVAYAGRWPGEPPDKDTPKWKLPPGYWKTQDIFNLFRIAEEPAETPLVIVEGFIGAMWLHQLGHHKVIALMGSTMSDVQLSLIAQRITASTRIVIMFDEDEAGREGRDEIAPRLAALCYVRIHRFPEEGTQPESLQQNTVE